MMYVLEPAKNKQLSYIPTDLRYFWDHFIGEPMIETWQVPPITIRGKSYKATDFVGWYLGAPIVSARGREALAEICDGLVEFLSFHEIKKKKYFAMNVLNFDQSQPIHKRDAMSKVYVNDAFGAIVRDNGLTGVALADPDDSITMGRIVRGEKINIFPGLAG